MKILFGTSNPAKLAFMNKAIARLDDIELISLNDVSGEIPPVPEDGNTPLDNAVQKAKAYYEAFKMPVFSCDSGLYFENLPDFSPMVHVRNVNGKCLSDDEMIEYYSGLALKYGDIVAQYKNAICFILDENHIFTDSADDLNGNKFIIISKPHHKRIKGFPLDSISKNLDGVYYFDMPKPLEASMNNGFYRFFSKIFTNG